MVEFVSHTILHKGWWWYGSAATPRRNQKFWIITHGQIYKQQDTEKTAALKIVLYQWRTVVYSMMTTQERVRVKEHKRLATHHIILYEEATQKKGIHTIALAAYIVLRSCRRFLPSSFAHNFACSLFFYFTSLLSFVSLRYFHRLLVLIPITIF